jgi:hypothetical protein
VNVAVPLVIASTIELLSLVTVADRGDEDELAVDAALNGDVLTFPNEMDAAFRLEGNVKVNTTVYVVLAAAAIA